MYLSGNWLLNQMVEHILSLYILSRGVPNLTQADWAISIIWLRYIMQKKKKKIHYISHCQSTALVTTLLLTWMSETNKSPQSFFFFTYYTVT